MNKEIIKFTRYKEKKDKNSVQTVGRAKNNTISKEKITQYKTDEKTKSLIYKHIEKVLLKI